MVTNFFTLQGQTKEVVKAGGGVMKDVTACEAEPKASTSAKPDLETAKDASKHAPKVHKWCLKVISSKHLDLKIYLRIQNVVLYRHLLTSNPLPFSRSLRRQNAG